MKGRVWCALLVGVVGAAGAGTSSAQAPSAGPCLPGEPVQRCAFNQDASYNLPIEVRQLAALVRPRDTRRARRLYRALVPDVFTLPRRPRVALWFVDVAAPRRAGAAQRWTEASIALRARHDGETGWFQISQPVDSPVFYDYGRGVGFAKVMARTSFAPRSDGGWRATADAAGQRAVDLDFTPRPMLIGRELAAFSVLEDPWLSLYPVFEGPRMMRVKYTPKAALPGAVLPAPQTGRLRYRLHGRLDSLDEGSPEPLPDVLPPGRTLADLIPLRGTVAGTFTNASISLGVDIARAGDCGDACWPQRGGR